MSMSSPEKGPGHQRCDQHQADDDVGEVRAPPPVRSRRIESHASSIAA